ncbi:uncharacterized protein T551_00212 [Pneumocystis jirovecii RU7]|uniref:Uncharacterized protein n=1 Tax=Pneumocystis jirovecii (strain RU7) TaxID=1408657 RepID=A0A0W4ZWH9_PNEJ7|nr:uncharacterized protein T551_00212 [Pneumocystis jirovecii RU7]KTW32727.1 hypothetical protein T551_00212 [Pneumocystis jirovecii RU7]
MKQVESVQEKQMHRSKGLYVSQPQVLVDAAVPTSALQVEELTPTLIFPRETCLDMLSKHSSCSGSSEVDLCCSGHASGLQNGGTGESSVSPSSPFFNRIYTGTHSHGFLEQDGYVSFPPLDLYQQDKRSTPVRN